MKWITRERPKIDRVACPWLIARFIDRDATLTIGSPFDVVWDKSMLLMLSVEAVAVKPEHIVGL